MFSSRVTGSGTFFGLLLAVLGFSCGALAQPGEAPRSIDERPLAPLSLAELQTLTGGPTLISFTGNDVPIATVVKAFRAAMNRPLAAGEIIIGSAKTPQTISVAWNQVPFWTAAQQAETKSGLRWTTRFFSGFGLLPADFGGLGNLDGRVGAQTPFVKLVATSVSRLSSATTSFSANQAPISGTHSGDAQLNLSVYFDPKLKVEGSTIQNLKFEDALGAAITGPTREINSDLHGRSADLNLQLFVPLPATLRAGDTVSRVSGTLRTTLSLASDIWKVPDLNAAPKPTHDAGIVRYTVESLSFQDGQLRLQISALNAPRNAPNAEASQVFAGLRVRDSQNRELPGLTVTTKIGTAPDGRRQTQNELAFSLKNIGGLAPQGPFSLEWPLATQTRLFDVPFELRDLLIP